MSPTGFECLTCAGITCKLNKLEENSRAFALGVSTEQRLGLALTHREQVTQQPHRQTSKGVHQSLRG